VHQSSDMTERMLPSDRPACTCTSTSVLYPTCTFLLRSLPGHIAARNFKVDSETLISLAFIKVQCNLNRTVPSAPSHIYGCERNS
jgi:hypothetical protein